jgi:hypothetical protein
VRQYNGPAVTDCASAIAVDNSGNVYVTGRSEGDSIFLEYTTVKYSSSGDLVWTQRYQGPGAGHNAATDLALDGLGNVYVTGSSQGVSTGYDFATIRYTELLCGDANGDETVDLGDVVYLIGYLYRNEPAPDPVVAGDVNRDGIVDLGDLVYMISYLYKNGPPPCSS